MLWDVTWYELCCDIDTVALSATLVTKSNLSVVQKVFDPVGFTFLVTIIYKLLLQEAWRLMCGRDEDLLECVASKFMLGPNRYNGSLDVGYHKGWYNGLLKLRTSDSRYSVMQVNCNMLVVYFLGWKAGQGCQSS
jgi:hypothetical protein